MSRAAWGITDQALSSFGNFALTVLIARETAPREFGAFAVVIASYIIFVGLSRGLAGEPLIIRFSAASADDHSRSFEQSSAAATAIGIAFGVLVAATGLLLGGSLRTNAVTLAVFLPGLLLQDNLRYAALVRGRAKVAVTSDASWTALFLAVGVPASMQGAHAWELLAIWGLLGNLAAVVPIVALGVRPRIAHGRLWFSSHSDLGWRYAMEFLATQGVGQLLVYFISASAGLSAAASFRGAQTVFGPLVVLNQGIRLAVLPEVVRIRARRPEWFTRSLVGISVSLGAFAAAWGVVALRASARVGHAVLGATWGPSHPLLLGMSIVTAANAVSLGALSGLRALADARRSLRARTVVAAASLLGGVAGDLAAGARGATAGLACASAIGAAVWWLSFTSSRRSAGLIGIPPVERERGTSPVVWQGSPE